ncbi:MAG: DUF6488 family protein [Pseudomonadota bacterium]|nr:DUF6488 family protein [Pseudomonadota bacterium]
MIKILSMSVMLVLSVTAYAGGGHDHGHGHSHDSTANYSALSDSEVLALSSEVLPQLIDEGYEVEGKVLDESWRSVADTAQISDKGNGYFVVNFTKSDQEKVYLLMSETGDLYSVNYSGNFAGLQ